MTKEICGNCGPEKKHHKVLFNEIQGKHIGCLAGTGEFFIGFEVACKCKKFTPHQVGLKEESLSDKIISYYKEWEERDEELGCIRTEDVKEAVKKLKNACNDSKNYCDESTAKWFDIRVIDKIFGEKLI